MHLNASDIREARLHTHDIVNTALAQFKAYPNNPNAEVLLSPSDINQLLLLIEVAEVYAEERATRRLNEKYKRRGEIR